MGNQLHTSLLHSWQGIDDAARLDTATINLEQGRLSAHGTSRTDEYAMSWALTTTEGWVTRRLTATVHGHGWSRHLELDRSDDGVWSSTTHSSGECPLPGAGIDDPSSLTGALDCDLGLCPVTNTMPILRLNLHSEELAPADETSMAMAWVEVPSLRVVRSQQMYSQLRAPGEDRNGVILYSSDNHGFTAELQIDRDGIVVEYPGLATLTG
ncbi:putative glycolipid-binding domain-containing protein [Arthrobacter tecti]